MIDVITNIKQNDKEKRMILIFQMIPPIKMRNQVNPTKVNSKLNKAENIN